MDLHQNWQRHGVMRVTPYARLLVDPHVAEDADVRRRFHALAKDRHPDVQGRTWGDAEWFEVVQAYNALRTQAQRDIWLRRQMTLSRLCPGCAGMGVRPGRGPVAVCPACAGEGRSEKSKKETA